MILIIGGAYQAKLDFAKETFGIAYADVFTCTGGEIDFSKWCICKIEEFAYPKFIPEDHVLLKLIPAKWEDKW